MVLIVLDVLHGLKWGEKTVELGDGVRVKGIFRHER